jgi:y4mF family transcriptional regulator
LYAKAYRMNAIMVFVKSRRKQLKLTQEELAAKSGVALTVIRKIEQGKENLSLAKVNQVLKMFGHVLGPINDKQL